MAAYKGVVVMADYNFDKSAGTITFGANYTGIELSEIMYITNLVSNTVIYDPSDLSKGGSISSLVLTLTLDTSTMNDSDELQIIIGTGSLASVVSTGLNTVLDDIDATLDDIDSLAATSSTSLASINTKTPALGQALAAGSIPVVLTAIQQSALTPPAAITGFLSESDFDTKAGALTETAPATDIASSGINGRLQRIAQRLSSLITALGSPFQAGASIGNTTFASTVADGSNIAQGSLADAIVAAGATGSISAKLRRVTQGLEDLKTLIVLGAGSALIGKVGIDQTTPGTTNAVVAAATLAAETTKIIGTINVAASQTIAVTNAGTFPVQSAATLAAETTKVIGTVNIASGQSLAANQSSNVAQINGVTPLMGAGNTGTGSPRVTIATDQATVPTTPAGNVASDAVDSGNPLKIGGQARSSLMTAVSNAHRVNATFDTYGRIITAYIDPAQQIWKEVEASTTQTGTAIWTPTSGSKIAITSIHITTGGTTAGVATIWIGASGDTTYSQGVDQVVFRGEFAPSTTSRPFAMIAPQVPYFAVTTDHVLKYTTTAAMTIYITVYGYEFI